MEEIKVNNWKAAGELQRFKVKYVDPAREKVDEARKILDDPLYKWRKGEKDKAKLKFALLDAKNIDYHRVYSSCMELVAHHEKQTDMLTEIYAEWFNMVATEGLHPLEIMKMQQDIMQRIWARIYIAIEPLNLNLESPKS